MLLVPAASFTEWERVLPIPYALPGDTQTGGKQGSRGRKEANQSITDIVSEIIKAAQRYGAALKLKEYLLW